MKEKTKYARCSPAKLLEFLQSQTQPLTVPEIVAATNMQKRRVFESVTRLAREGSVVRSGKRHGYKYEIARPESTASE